MGGPREALTLNPACFTFTLNEVKYAYFAQQRLGGGWCLRARVDTRSVYRAQKFEIPMHLRCTSDVTRGALCVQNARCCPKPTSYGC
jgi:hypothetical protein